MEKAQRDFKYSLKSFSIIALCFMLSAQMAKLNISIIPSPGRTWAGRRGRGFLPIPNNPASHDCGDPLF